MENMEYIDNYFTGQRSNEEVQLFEKRIIEDATFAAEVAFYISAKGAVQSQVIQEKKQRFSDLYNQQTKVVSINTPAKSFNMRYLAAACCIGIVVMLTWSIFSGKTDPSALADTYIKQNWPELPVTMSTQKDSLQIAGKLYKAGDFSQSLLILEKMLKTDSTNAELKKYAGIVSLQTTEYDKALQYFSSLATDTSLYINDGKFYEAVTLLKRNNPQDVETAKSLLRDITDNDLEKKEEAEKWLKKLE